MSRVLYIYVTRHHDIGNKFDSAREAQVYLTEPASAGSLLMVDNVAHAITGITKCPGDAPDVLMVTHKTAEHYIVPVREQVL